ncbi:MAG: hypothetical protein PVJ76_02920 [Gemmatimonadota bacterium]
MLKGLLAAGITLGVAAVFPEPLAFSFFAGVLGLVVGVYPGMAMASPDGDSAGPQWAVAVVLLGLGLLGLWHSPLLLSAAWLLHAFWSFLKRFTALGDEIPEGYPAFCLSFDLVMAAFVAYMWATSIQA